MSRSGVPVLAALALAACGGGEEPAAPEAAPFEIRPVVAPGLAELEARVAAESPAPPPPEDDPDELRERVRGLCTFVSGASAALRDTALAEVRDLGDRAVPPLADLLGSDGAEPGERTAAAQLLATVGSPRAAACLLGQVESAREPWVRAHCAWQLAAAGQEWIVPRLVLRLKYEKDHDAAIWIASTLGRFGNYAGLLALENVRDQGITAELRGSAAARLAELAQGAGLDDPAELRRLWDAGDPEGRLPARERGPRYELEVWRKIQGLDDFQLRPVDDGRFVLSRLGALAATRLGRALHDESEYVRIHATQSLERMGPRAWPAADELTAALDDPTLAPHAAAALGTLRDPAAEPALAARLGPEHDLGLRIACARALGWLGLPRATTALRSLLAEGEALELRQAAAESILYSDPDGADRALLELLLELMTSELVEPTSSENALGWWLERRSQGQVAAAPAVLAEWRAVTAAPPGVVPTVEQSAEARERRAALVRERLDELLTP